MEKIIMYGTDWCVDCHRSKAILKDRNIEFEYINIDEDEIAAKKIIEINKGKRIVPTLIIDGVAHTNPSYLELIELLKFRTLKNAS